MHSTADPNASVIQALHDTDETLGCAQAGFGQKLKGSFYRGSFHKGVQVPGSGGWWGAGFPVKKREKGDGVGRVGGGVGTGKGTGKSMRKLCRNYPLAIYPLV